MSAGVDGDASLNALANLVAAPQEFVWSQDRSDAELEALLVAAEPMSQTNCWWATYRAALLVKDEVPRVLADRAKRQEADQ